MKLRAITAKDVEQIRLWREGKEYMLRSETNITDYSQKQWFETVVSNRNSNFRFFAIENESGVMVGYCALEIDFRNGWAEIGLLIGDDYQNQGYGLKTIPLLLEKAFNEYRLNHLVYECYECNPSIEFWHKVGKRYNAIESKIPMRKFYNGKFFNSLYGVIVNER